MPWRRLGWRVSMPCCVCMHLDTCVFCASTQRLCGPAARPCGPHALNAAALDHAGLRTLDKRSRPASPPPAAEQIVIPRCQPVELLPRDPRDIDAQIGLVQSQGLAYEVVGAADSLRLRVLPPAWAGAGTTAGPASGRGTPAAPGSDAQDAPPAEVEGAKQKEYW